VEFTDAYGAARCLEEMFDVRVHMGGWLRGFDRW